MTTELQTRLLQLAQRSDLPKSLDIAASFMRKMASEGDSMDKFSRLNAHLAKLSPLQREKLIAAVDELLVEDPVETAPQDDSAPTD